MNEISCKDFIRAIEKRGWFLLRISGSHHIYRKSGSIVGLSVPAHGNRPMKAGLVQHLLKLAENDPADI